MNFKDILDKSNQSIYFNKYRNPTGSFATIFPKTAGKANMYVRLGFFPKKRFFQT